MREHLMTGRGARRVAILLPLLIAVGALVVASPSAAHPRHKHKHHTPPRRPYHPGPSTHTHSLSSHGQPLHIARVNSNQSSNWFGYNQGLLEKGAPFTSISGSWTVPTATQHTSGQDESSSDWIGIGGGCLDTSCTLNDSTLIQTGTEQDVSSNGTASYSAWYELVPAPSLTVNMPVSPGDQMTASITEAAPAPVELWTITLTNVTKGQTFTTTVPYTSTMGTAEWIEETPLLIGTNAGFAALPNLTKVPFTNATADGAPANLQPSEEMQLIDSSGKVIGTPSAPTSSQSFNACAWATSCS